MYDPDDDDCNEPNPDDPDYDALIALDAQVRATSGQHARAVLLTRIIRAHPHGRPETKDGRPARKHVGESPTSNAVCIRAVLLLSVLLGHVAMTDDLRWLHDAPAAPS